MLEKDSLNPVVSRRQLMFGVPKALAKGYLTLKAVEAELAHLVVVSVPIWRTVSDAMLVSNQQEEDEVIEADHGLIVPWSTHLWFPLVSDVARDRGIPQIYPFLRLYDTAYQNKYGEKSGAEEWQREFAEGENGLLKRLRGAEYLSAGFCHAVGNAAVWQTPPLEGENERYGIKYGREARVAFMAVKHAGDKPQGFTTTRSGIEDILLNYFPQSRIPLVANMPLGESGRWFRVIYQVIKKGNGSIYVKATNLGKKDIEVPITEVKSVHEPALPQYSRSAPHQNSDWINPEVFKDNGELLNELINN